MSRKSFFRLLALAVISLMALSQVQLKAADLKLVPLPQKITQGSGNYVLGQTMIICPQNLENEGAYLRDALAPLGIRAVVGSGRAPKGMSSITLKTGNVPGGNEAYALTVTGKGVTVTGASPAGVFYGAVTLLQLVEGCGATLPCVSIEDAPRFGWRGYMLDESRHFFGKEKVLQYLDLMAWHKMNVFHWHLTDQPGWRIEIKEFPKLAEEGSKGSYSTSRYGYVKERVGTEPALYYTQDDVREILAYAEARHIEIIPEIDMPGHANAAVYAYPEFSGGSVPRFGAFTFNPFKEETYAFLSKVLREVAGLFPSEYISIGGDEVWFGRASWDNLPQKEAFMREHSLKDLVEVERYFKSRMCDSIRAMGKKMVGWDELVEDNADKNSTTIQWWRHDKPEVLDKALETGYQTILCPRLPCYFDYKQDLSQKVGPSREGKANSLEACYNFPDPILDAHKAGSENIIGLQANLWSETITDADRLDYMTWPRLSAIAEDGWTEAGRKDYASFRERLGLVLEHLDYEDIWYCDESHAEPYGFEITKKYTQSLRQSLDKLFPVRAFHVVLPAVNYADSLIAFVNDDLGPAGFNQLILNVNWAFNFKSHPELTAWGAWPVEKIKELVKACRNNGVELVPMLDLLGHQSWQGSVGKLLTTYPQFNETPWLDVNKYKNGGWPNEDGYYCLSYCPNHPDLHPILFDCIDEIMDAFEATKFHGGMDEVFYIADDRCPRCAGMDKAQLFADEVNRIHDHLRMRGARFMIWSDRLLDGSRDATGYGEWEASNSGTHRALPLIAKDVIMCDWHYNAAEQSAVQFALNGFDVITCGWKKPDVTRDQLRDMVRFRANSSRATKPHYLGFMQTVWGGFPRFLKDLHGDLKHESEARNYVSLKKMYTEYFKKEQ